MSITYHVDIALQIVTDCPELAINGKVLELLARKPYAFDAIRSHIIWRYIFTCKNLISLIVTTIFVFIVLVGF